MDPLRAGFPEAIFQLDNARPQTARMSKDYICHITMNPWPARSLDLSPIEHIWDHFGWQVEQASRFGELEVCLQQLWNEMSQVIAQN
ncbi:transposable element Tcb2 transposase [Trichonephila clavipes]|nr:transposable element Tcb2 transposase [Trichonephila clavipes]